MNLKPETAVNLVYAYAHWNRAIKSATKAIGDSLTRCFDARVGKVKAIVASEHADHDTHLSKWYTPTHPQHQQDELVWEEITDEIHGKECEHCYQAHLAILDRKHARKKLGQVKAAMSKSKPSPNGHN
jgi:hypothetical protein